MSPLDNRALIKQIDQNNYLTHILDVPEQLLEGFDLGMSITIPALYVQAKQVVILATGEMAPVAVAIQELSLSYSRVPVVVIEDYVLPHWVSSDTLVIALDYYGTTDQVLTAYREAASRKARLLAVSVGGDLAKESRRVRSLHVPLNYGSPARIAFFYVLSCMAALFKKLDVIEIKEATISEASVLCRSLLENINPEVAQYQNNAKQLTEKIFGRATIVVGSGPLRATSRKWHSTFAATGKTVVTSSSLSEFNDTIINGLGYQTKATESPLVVMLQSKYDHARNKLQQTLTYQVAHAQKVMYEQIFMHPSGSAFGEIVLSSLLGEMVGYYLALLMHTDPSILEATTYIKQKLAQSENE